MLRDDKGIRRRRKQTSQGTLYGFKQIRREAAIDGVRSRRRRINPKRVHIVVNVDLLKPPVNRAYNPVFLVSSTAQLFFEPVVHSINLFTIMAVFDNSDFGTRDLGGTKFRQLFHGGQNGVRKVLEVLRFHIHQTAADCLNGNSRRFHIACSWYALYRRRTGMREVNNVKYDRLINTFSDTSVQHVKKVSDFLDKNRQFQVAVVFVRPLHHKSNFRSSHHLASPANSS